MVRGPVQLPLTSYHKDQDTLLSCAGKGASELPVAQVTGMFRGEGWGGGSADSTVMICGVICSCYLHLWSGKVLCLVCLPFRVWGAQDLTV